jgi:hypoxanthine phosphoribosyltransferase
MSGTEIIAPTRSEAYRKFLNMDRTIYMTMAESLELSHDLADVIGAEGGRPDLLAGAANGALLPMKIVADALNIPFHVIYLRRKGSRYKQALYRMKKMLGIPTSFLTIRPIRALQTAFEKRTRSFEQSDDTFDFDVSGKSVVLVDDAIQTGGTARHIKERLLANGASRVIIAVICWYKGPDDSGDWQPDVYLHRGYQWYPWSNNSPYFENYLSWLAENDLRYWG